MPQGGRLRVRTARLDEAGPVDETSESSIRSWAVLEVSDTGTGIDPDAVARIFDPFFTTKGPPAGTGLGLATVHRVVERAGGTIEIATARGAGTTFRVRLPREAGAAPPIEEPAGPAPRGSETVLVVEDQPSVRHLIIGMLEGQGYRVLEAGNAEEALHAASGHPDDIDLLVTDIVMPGMNGRELAERLAATRPRLRTLFISGYPDDEVLRGGVEQGTAELLPKPFTMEVLARRVRRLLDR
jgi:CheY-like chemotaxis protein